ncbi:MAG: Sir2 family NAD-dependent protein deacetylase [Pseudomonadota bacterium]
MNAITRSIFLPSCASRPIESGGVTLSDPEQACIQAAELISQADGLLITAGAGMGIDSGLPDFRGDQGFWRAYPALGTLGIRFAEIASPRAFRTDPALAWGFYGHRLQLYRAVQPHAGFHALIELAATMPHGAAVFTSNVDRQFQKAGFDSGRVTECHGSIHLVQCLAPCSDTVWPADDIDPVVDAVSGHMVSTLPSCPRCGGLARPNILMFNDAGWIEGSVDKKNSRFQTWITRLRRPVVIELGAGTAIPSVRIFGQQVGCPMIRINPREHEVALARDIGIAMGAQEAIARIVAAMRHAG